MIPKNTRVYIPRLGLFGRVIGWYRYTSHDQRGYTIRIETERPSHTIGLYSERDVRRALVQDQPAAGCVETKIRLATVDGVQVLP